MNYLNKNTPEGTRDLLYSEAELYDDLTRLLAKITKCQDSAR